MPDLIDLREIERRHEADADGAVFSQIVQLERQITMMHADRAVLLDVLRETRRALTWALAQLDRGDGVLEYTGVEGDGVKARAALALAVDPDAR